MTPWILSLAFAFFALLSGRAAEKIDSKTVENVARSYLAREPAGAIPLSVSYEDSLPAQQEFVRLIMPRYGKLAGYKVGLITPAGQQRFRVSHPVRGVLLRKMLLPNNSTVPANIGTRTILEADLLVRVKDEGINQAKTMEAAARHLSEVVTFIELADGIFATNVPMDAGVLMAANSGARAGILGERCKVQSTPEFIESFGKMSMILRKDGQEVSRASASGILGHPLNAVLWLVEDMGKHGEKLRAGQVLSLGSPSPAESPKPGENYTLTYEGLPGGPAHATVHFK